MFSAEAEAQQNSDAICSLCNEDWLRLEETCLRVIEAFLCDGRMCFGDRNTYQRHL